jgi:hypothetical protein
MDCKYREGLKKKKGMQEDLGLTFLSVCVCRPPVTAVADYLRALHAHVLEDVSRGFAKNYHADTFRYCLTVPAMWSDQAKNCMRQAAVQAGLVQRHDPPDRLHLISEPEAAALYCEKMCDQVNLLPTDRLMICDAGGGTVDLIVFEVDGPSKLKEITKGLGESCGSMFLDEHFSRLLLEKLGGQPLPKSALRIMVDQFVDSIKPEFDGLDDQYLNLPAIVKLDLLCEPDPDCVDEGTLILRASELKEKVFEPVVKKVVRQKREKKKKLDQVLNFILFYIDRSYGTTI